VSVRQKEASNSKVKAIATCTPDDVSSAGANHQVTIDNQASFTVLQIDITCRVLARPQIAGMAAPAPPCIEWTSGNPVEVGTVSGVTPGAKPSLPSWGLKKTASTQATSETIRTSAVYVVTLNHPQNPAHPPTPYHIPQAVGSNMLDYTTNAV
jgi:hypothetical protein